MKNEPEKPLRKVTASEARALLERQRQSALNVATFARSQGVEPWCLYNVRAIERRRARRAAGSRLAEVRVVESPTSTTAAPVELALPSGVSIRVTRDFDEVALRRVLGVLGSC